MEPSLIHRSHRPSFAPPAKSGSRLERMTPRGTILYKMQRATTPRQLARRTSFPKESRCFAHTMGNTSFLGFEDKNGWGWGIDRNTSSKGVSLKAKEAMLVRGRRKPWVHMTRFEYGNGRRTCNSREGEANPGSQRAFLFSRQGFHCPDGTNDGSRIQGTC